MQLTELLIEGLAKHLAERTRQKLSELPALNVNVHPPFKKLDFVSEIEKALGRSLPKLTESDASEQVLQILADLSLQPTASCSLPQMLDKLSATFLEPQCWQPTFIIHHPECMSPLSKSFEHPSFQGQPVAARAELFIKGKEIANMYEEENSPFEQRRKFTEQVQYRARFSDNHSGVDEQYLEALEWGLPPVGGWGCGIERLCMVLTGTSRIGDVMSFGTLKNVIARSQ